MNQYKIDVSELDEESETVEQPDDINIQLKPHQLTLLYKCIDFENNRIKLKSYKSKEIFLEKENLRKFIFSLFNEK